MPNAAKIHTEGGADMTILWFLFGAFCGGFVVAVAMAMVFVAKKADEAEVYISAPCPPETSVQGLCTADR